MNTLLCSDCRAEKDAAEFSMNRGSTRGYSYKCKECSKKYYSSSVRKQIYAARRRLRYGRELKEMKAQYYQNNKGRIKEYYQTKGYLSHKFAKLKYKYGISKEEYISLYNLQEGKCAICKCGIDILGKYTHLDHNHSTGVIRGLLCHSCNVGIGFLKSVAYLEEAVKYLQKP